MSRTRDGDIGVGAPVSSARRAHEVALQMLYQWEVGQSDIETVAHVYAQHEAPGSAPSEAVRAFAEQLARATTANLKVIDPLISEHAEHWRLSRMAVLDRLILRMAVYELLHTKTPRPIVMNEAIELAKKFSTEDSAKFVNGVLDAIARHIAE
ncbi:MAG: transcription antitermination factor NusB [Vicinamibacterales bacterium]